MKQKQISKEEILTYENYKLMKENLTLRTLVLLEGVAIVVMLGFWLLFIF